jgi:hypothetical protein
MRMPQTTALQTTIKLLTSFPAQLENTFMCVPDILKNWRPESWSGIPSERLTAIEQLCHIRDVEVEGYHLRIKRTLSEHNPVLPDIDGEAWARDRPYATENAAAVLAQIKAAREVTINALRDLSEQQLNRVAVFDNRPTTLRGLAHFLCSHDQQHLAGMQWLLAKMEEIDRV